MNENVVFLEDIPKLSRDDLEELCKGINQKLDGSIIDLTSRIWENRNSLSILENTKEKIFAGKRAITWYKFENKDINCKDCLNKALGFDVFNEIRFFEEANLSDTPQIMAATEIDEGKYYLRCAYKSGFDKVISGNTIRSIPRMAVVTIYLEESKNFIEIRTGDKKLADRAAKMIASLFGEALGEYQVRLPYSSDLGRMADLLGGILIDAKSKVNVILDTFGEEEKNAVVKVIEAITLYFEEANPDNLVTTLDAAKDYISAPFVLMLINGLDTVGLGSNKEVRETLLFDWIKPYMEHQDGFIRFINRENGLDREYTIRIGVKKNTVFFNTPATESSIEFIRNKLILA